MINEQKLIEKCNRMSLILGMFHGVLAQQYNEHPSESLKECVLNFHKLIEKEFYSGAEE